MVGCVAVGSVPLAAVGEVIVRVGVKTAGLVTGASLLYAVGNANSSGSMVVYRVEKT